MMERYLDFRSTQYTHAYVARCGIIRDADPRTWFELQGQLPVPHMGMRVIGRTTPHLTSHAHQL